VSRYGVAWRLARRDITRAPARTLLTMAMVALPVLAVTTGDVLLRGIDAVGSSDQPLDLLGPQAEALVRVQPGRPAELSQDASGNGTSFSEATDRPPLTAAEVLAVLPAGSRLASVETGIAAITLPEGPGRVRAVLADPADPLLAGRYTVNSGRRPAAADEVAVAPSLLAAGLTVGGSVQDDAGQSFQVVGVLPDADGLSSTLLGLPGATDLQPEEFTPSQEWLVDGPADVTYDDVLELNALGAVVTSRAVLRDPPPETEQPSSGGASSGGIVVVGLVVAMAVLEIVLLAGPAFAVSARRQRRGLAQLSAAGGRPQDSQLVVLLGALLLGSVAALTGVALGVGTAVLVRAAGPVFAQGSLQVPVLDLAAIVVVAVLSALLAAVVPARSASRQDLMAVLTDRPVPTRPSPLPVTLGFVLLAVGVLACARAARGGDEYSVALAAVPTVLGAALLAPLALATAARLSPRLPFALRYAVRDAARQRGRTAPAVAAIAAVVAGAVALGTGASSDAAQYRADDARAAAVDVALVTGQLTDQAVWDRLESAVAQAGGTGVAQLRGLDDPDFSRPVSVCGRADPAGGCAQGLLAGGFGGSFSSSVLVGESGLAAVGIVGADRDRALEALAAGGAVAFTDQPERPETVALQTGGASPRSTTVPVALIDTSGGFPLVEAVLSEATAEALDLTVVTTALVLDAPTDTDAISDAIALRAPEVSLNLPGQGVDSDRGTGLVLLLLGAVAGVLVLGGVLTSTLLALSDARPQFATLHAVGAADRSRRSVAAGHAATLGVLGALLGLGAGLVIGVAVAYPLTTDGRPLDGLLPPFLDVPWLLLVGLVAAVPAVAALVAALSARGPLPDAGRKALA